MIFSIITADEKIIVYHQIQLLKKTDPPLKNMKLFRGGSVFPGG